MRSFFLVILFCVGLVLGVRSENITLDQAQQYFNQGQYEKVVPILQRRSEELEQKGDRVNKGIALANLAIAYRYLGEWTLAEKFSDQSITLLSTSTNSPYLASALDTRARLHWERGQAQEAFTQWTKSAEFFQKAGQTERWQEIQIDRSLALQALGLYPRSCELLWTTLGLSLPSCILKDDTLAAIEKIPLSRSKLQILSNLGNVLQVMGQLQGSESLLRLGLGQAESLGTMPEAAAIYLHLGNTFRALGAQPGISGQRQDSFYRSAAKNYELAAKETTTGLQAKLNLLSLQVQQGQKQRAKELWQELSQESFPIGRTGLFARLNFLQSSLRLVQDAPEIDKEIDRFLEETTKQAEKLGNRQLQTQTLLFQGSLAEIRKDLPQAQKFTRAAIGQNPPPEIAYQLFWQMGRINHLQGKITAAIRDYSQAVQTLSTLRGDLTALNSDIQYSFREGVEPIYRELVSLLLQSETPDQKSLNQARQVIESLQVAELDNFFRDACANVEPRSIDQLDSKAAIFYPIVLDDRLEIIVAIPQQPLFHFRILQSSKTLAKTIQEARNSIRITAPPEERLAPTLQLYEWLIRPSEALLQKHQVQTLVFIPHSILRNLPLGILWDGKQYLIEKYSLALSPSLQLIAPEPLPKTDLSAITAGLTESRQGFPALPGVAKELQNIARTLSTAAIVNDQFTSSALQNKLQNLDTPIVHLATHGQFSSNAELTFLLTWNDRIKVKDLNILLESRADKPIELLILSACETAVGDDRAALGLAGVAIRSGARSTIASLWAAYDTSTALLMTKFYQEIIKPGVDKARALRNAQLHLLHTSEFRHPYYWAAFTLLGNWQ